MELRKVAQRLFAVWFWQNAPAADSRDEPIHSYALLTKARSEEPLCHLENVETPLPAEKVRGHISPRYNVAGNNVAEPGGTLAVGGLPFAYNFCLCPVQLL